jgi:Spy/CpxP family protein refolding chaperone
MTLWISTLTLALALIAAPGSARGAWPGGGLGKHHGKFWKKEKVREKLRMGDDQVEQLEGIFARHQQTLSDLETDVKKSKAELDELLADDQVDDQRVLAEVDALERARAKLGKARVTMLLEMRRVLTPAQRDELADHEEDDD